MSGNRLLSPSSHHDNDDSTDHKNNHHNEKEKSSDSETNVNEQQQQRQFDSNSTTSNSDHDDDNIIMEPNIEGDDVARNEAGLRQRVVVTPSTTSARKSKKKMLSSATAFLSPSVKRNLFDHDVDVDVVADGSTTARMMIPMTPSSASPAKLLRRSRRTHEEEEEQDTAPPPTAKRRLLFGRHDPSTTAFAIDVPSNIKLAYRIVHRRTNAIGGNGSFGPIYGELTIGSMQRMIRAMKQYTHLNQSSRFIDVGSGIGKPNVHVTQDPGVAISYGIESEESRWLLSMNSLHGILETCHNTEPSQQQQKVDQESLLQPCRCLFVHENIKNARTFDPFTHVYMFSIGFPPDLWIHLSEMWNASHHPTTKYLICFHGPRHIIDTYEFMVELITQLPTKMHGSNEGHTGYLYQRTTMPSSSKEATTTTSSSLPDSNTSSSSTTTLSFPDTTITDNQHMMMDVPCDPLYRDGIEMIQKGISSLLDHVSKTIQQQHHQPSSSSTQQQIRRSSRRRILRYKTSYSNTEEEDSE